MTTTGALPEVFRPVLERLPADAVAYFDGAPVRLVPTGSQDRPASHLLRLAVCSFGDDRPISHLFLKVYKPRDIGGGLRAMRQRVARDYDMTRQVYTSMRQYVDIGAVPPVACYPDLLAIVTEEVEGPTLLEYLQTHAAWYPSERRVERLRKTMATVGRWIRVFQSTGSPGTSLRVEDLRAYIDLRLERLARQPRARFTPTDRVRVLRHIDRLGSQIAPAELVEVPAHADMSLGNLLVSDQRVVVLDFGMAGRGSRLQDLTKVYLQVELLGAKPQMQTAVIRRLQGALLQGFDPSLTIDRPLFRLMLLLHRVNHLLGLSVGHAPLSAAVYNQVLRRKHRQWIATELSHQPDVVEGR